MATVRITKELTERLVRAGEAPFHKQYDTVRNGVNFDHHAESIWSALWGAHAATVMALPDHALNRGQTMKVRARGGNNETVDLRLSLPDVRPMPYKIPTNELIEPVWGDSIALREHLYWADLFREVREWRGQLDAISKQRLTFVNNLHKLLAAYSTLAPALKAWPPLWDLLPDDVKEKHKDVTKREKKEVALDGVDFGSMTAIVATRKLLGQ
jgi:hypothetical protein